MILLHDDISGISWVFKVVQDLDMSYDQSLSLWMWLDHNLDLIEWNLTELIRYLQEWSWSWSDWVKLDRCKDNEWSNHGNITDTNYLNILASNAIMPNNNPTLSDKRPECPTSIWCQTPRSRIPHDDHSLRFTHTAPTSLFHHHSMVSTQDNHSFIFLRLFHIPCCKFHIVFPFRCLLISTS